MTKTKWENQLREILEKHAYLEKNGHGYIGEVYVDYREQLPFQSIIDISMASSPRDRFFECFEAINIEEHELIYLFRLIRDKWPCKDDYYINEDSIIDWVHENVCFRFPYDHFLKQSVCVDVVVDTGDGNYDFTLNNFISYNADPNEKVDKKSSVLWLAEQQGYSEHQLNSLGQFDTDSRFIETIYSELVNVTSHMNALTFLFKTSLGEFINYKENPRDLCIPINTRCGLYDPWNGAGSLFEVELEKPVRIPKEFVRMYIDGAYGYGVGRVYGVHDCFWGKHHIHF